MTRPGIETRSPGPLANTLTARPMSEVDPIIKKKSFLEYKKKMKERTLSACWLPQSSQSQGQIQRNRKIDWILGACTRTEKTMENEGDNYFNNSRNSWKTLQEAERNWESWGSGRIVTVEMTALLKSVRIQRKILENWRVLQGLSVYLSLVQVRKYTKSKIASITHI